MVWRPLPHETSLPRLPGAVAWPYSPAEIWADGAVHAVGVGAALAATLAFLFVFGPGLPSVAAFAAVGIYCVTLVASFGISAAYNLWPQSRTKWMLRRLDHSAIYFLIAGTYTPFMVRLDMGGVLALVWLVAALGASIKLLLPGRFDRLSILLYLAMGWGGVALYAEIGVGLTSGVALLILVGGLLYSGGVVFHVLDRLRFHNAVWHLFVLAGAAVHFGAVVSLGWERALDMGASMA